VALSYIGFFSGVGKFGNLRGCVLRGQEVADFGEWISDTLVYIVIGIVWRSVIGKYCDCGKWTRKQKYLIFTVLPLGCYVFHFWRTLCCLMLVVGTKSTTPLLFFWGQIICFVQINKMLVTCCEL
jgi:hypothetical protein